MAQFRYIALAIWLGMFWGLLGGIAANVTQTVPDWAVILLSYVGGLAMFVYLGSKEGKREGD